MAIAGIADEGIGLAVIDVGKFNHPAGSVQYRGELRRVGHLDFYRGRGVCVKHICLCVVVAKKVIHRAHIVVRGIKGAHLDVSDISKAINEYIDGIGGNGHYILNASALGEAEVEAHPHVGLELPNILHGVHGKVAECKYLHAVAPLIVDLFHPGKLILAGTTPCGEYADVNQILLLQHLGKRDSFTFGVDE